MKKYVYFLMLVMLSCVVFGKELIFHDDFNRSNSNNLGNGWIELYESSYTEMSIKDNTIYVYDNSENKHPRAYHDFIFNKSFLFIEVDSYLEGIQKSGINIGLFDSELNELSGIAFGHNDDSIYYGSLELTNSLIRDEWVKIQIVYNFVNNTVSLFYNNSLLINEHAIVGYVEKPQYIILNGQYQSIGNSYYDNLNIYQSDEPPTTTPLLEKYSPVLYLTEQEKYFPMSVYSMLDNADLERTHDLPRITGPVSTSDLLSYENGYGFYLDLWDCDMKYDWAFPRPSIFDGYNYTVYGRQVDDEDYIILQYYMFYPFNNWHNRHEGDWEHLQLILDKDENILTVTADFHMLAAETHYPETLHWINETHVKILVSEGSHANYFEGFNIINFTNEGCLVNEIFDIEKISMEGPILHHASLEIDDPDSRTYEVVEIDDDTDWIQYRGLWGQNVIAEKIIYDDDDISSLGPVGPKYKQLFLLGSRWENPFFQMDGYPDRPFFAGFLHSPADIHVYDAGGNHVGIEGAFLEEDISGLMFYTGPDSEPEAFMIMGDNNYTVFLEATDEGTFNFSMFYGTGEGVIALRYDDVEISKDSVAIVEASRDSSFMMQVDYDGDGKEDTLIKPYVEDAGFGYTEPDKDGDGIPDMDDNCVDISNPDQADRNSDGIGDMCDNPRYYKEQSIAEIDRIGFEVSFRKKDYLKAKNLLLKSLDEKYWVNDYELDQDGNKVFDMDKQAVKFLAGTDKAIMRICGIDSGLGSVLSGILLSDKMIARYALDNISNKNAEKWYSQAEQYLQDEEYVKAIQYYGKAWEAVQTKNTYSNTYTNRRVR